MVSVEEPDEGLQDKVLGLLSQAQGQVRIMKLLCKVNVSKCWHFGYVCPQPAT